MEKFPMTLKGAEKLRAELDYLKYTRRPEVINAIAEARAHGDLKENAEYHSAREQQSFLEGRIKELEAKLGNAHVIDITNIDNTGKVIFGVTVTVLNLDNEKKTTYQIVGEDEADLKEGKISVLSPIARALIGHYVDEEVYVKTPNGETPYSILSVEHQ